MYVKGELISLFINGHSSNHDRALNRIFNAKPMKYTHSETHKTCNLGTLRLSILRILIGRRRGEASVQQAQSKLVMQIFLFNMYNYFDEVSVWSVF
jgi:hypothetical protein